MSKALLLVLSLVLFIVGLSIIFRSVNFGSDAANSYLQSRGGGMETAQFMIILQEYIQVYRWIGSILAIVGGFGFVKAIDAK